jgi:ribose/xylose/arabinose/galactoside ABC-type transport system permease subunit
MSAQTAGLTTRPLDAVGPWARQHRAKLALLSVILLIAVVTAARSETFLTWGNFENVLVQSAIIGILAMGTTLLMVSGGIDLSIGSAVSFCGVVMASLMASGWGPVLAVLACVAVASLLGLVTGGLAAKSTSHPFVVTLGMLTLVQGLALLVSETPVTDVPDSFVGIVDARPLGLPLVVFVFLAVAIAVHIVLRHTKLGRWLYAIGGSPSAARLSGIRVDVVKVATYALNGLLVGVAAVLLTAQLASAQPQMGQGLELSAIAAVAVGGTPLAGGRGDVVGTLLGVLLLALIGNSLNLLSIASNWQFVLQGAVILTAVMAQRSS